MTRTVKADPFSPHWVSGLAYKLHSMTGTALLLASFLVLVKEALGEHIHCIQHGEDKVHI